MRPYYNGINLLTMIQNRRWERHDDPFAYVYAQNVFKEEIYTDMEAEFNIMLNTEGKFQRNMSDYDASGGALDPETTMGSLKVFLSPQWHTLLNDLFGLTGTGYVNVGTHYHAIGSKSGFIHTDYNPVWFPIEGDGPIRFPKHELCTYKWGDGILPPERKIEVVRSVVMIYYLANEPWREGDGGETGFYTQSNADVTKPKRKIPPLNNSIVVYECTPFSYHSFITNTRHPRNSVIMWTHKTMSEAFERWDPNEYPLERWKR